MLLCAGFGTRLGELTDDRPKPALPVCDMPIVSFGVARLVAHGIRDIVINLHHHGASIEEQLGDGSHLGARIVYSREEDILDTGGGLKKALPFLDPDGRDEPFVSMNGKLIFDVDISALLDTFRRDENAIGTMVVQHVPDALQWGAVDVARDDAGHRVQNILGGGQYMFCGVHATRPSVIRRLPEGKACMVRQGYLPWLRGGERVSAYVHERGYFAEHSTPARYLESNCALVAGAELSHPPGPLSGVHPDAVVDATATITPPVRIAAGAQIEGGASVGPRAVIGRGARVRAGASVKDSVVWPSSEVRGPLERAIATPAGVVDVSDD